MDFLIGRPETNAFLHWGSLTKWQKGDILGTSGSVQETTQLSKMPTISHEASNIFAIGYHFGLHSSEHIIDWM